MNESTDTCSGVYGIHVWGVEPLGRCILGWVNDDDVSTAYGEISW